MRAPLALLVALLFAPLAVAGCGEGGGATPDPGDRPASETSQDEVGQDVDDPVGAEPSRVPDRFGTATVSSSTHPGCDAVVGADAVTVEAGGYVPGAEVVVSLQIVGGEPSLVATVDASDDGTVAVAVTLPDEPPGALGGFEVIGDAPDGLLLNEALLVFADPGACGGDQASTER